MDQDITQTATMIPSMMQKVNTYALRAFRDTADKDYIHARMAYKAELFPQFHWSSLHALEKYAKCIAILTRILKPKKPIKHEVTKSLKLISERVDIKLSDQTVNFIRRLEDYRANDRYLENSWFIYDPELAILDRAVWELRRYCNSELYIYLESQFSAVNSEKYKKIQLIDKPSKQNTFISGGFIEKTLDSKQSKTRPDLVWCNLYYSNSNRKSVLMKRIMMFENAPFYLYPEIIEEVEKYIFVSKEFTNA
ncbi:HEPN domain-containing protein [Methylotenera sp. N17]|uniref:HEPN domain-containing protein n=1 Tax=Methylotenera sp. N17 TaxID=1502761 RepID=UPI00068FC08A|nr:HEPN domain-containing protein [Methylotenera sp. N17]